MPEVATTYRAPCCLRNAHVQTVMGSFRAAPPVHYRRTRIETADGDFLDLDWAASGRDAPAGDLAIVSFGMEGDPHRPYVRGMVAALQQAGWRALVWNYRGTSGEPNRKAHFYHGGLIEDLEAVIRHVISRGACRLALVGFSLGGNLTLNYLGRRGGDVPRAVTAAVAFSVPCDVEDCARQMRRPDNRVYLSRFLRSFRAKIRAKMRVMPDLVHDEDFERIRSLEEYDRRYTVPHFGFDDVPSFYRAVSSRHVLDRIRVPTLLVNALDDPIMGPDCFPRAEAAGNPCLHLELPAHGGHLGFLRGPFHRANWMEERAVQFLAAARRASQ